MTTSATSEVGVTSNSDKNNPREIFGWKMYDWANSAFYTTVVGALFGPYLTRLAQAAVGENGVVLDLGHSVQSRRSRCRRCVFRSRWGCRFSAADPRRARRLLGSQEATDGVVLLHRRRRKLPAVFCSGQSLPVGRRCCSSSRTSVLARRSFFTTHFCRRSRLTIKLTRCRAAATRTAISAARSCSS